MTDSRLVAIARARQGGYSQKVLPASVEYQGAPVDEFRIEYTVRVDAITGDQIIVNVDARYGFGSSTAEVYDFTEESATLTINGNAEGFREPEFPRSEGKPWGGLTGASFLLLVGVENEEDPFLELRPSILLASQSQSLWLILRYVESADEWASDIGFDCLTPPCNPQTVLIGNQSPAFDAPLSNFNATGAGQSFQRSTGTDSAESFVAQDLVYSFFLEQP